jgi:hypothetical protein
MISTYITISLYLRRYNNYVDMGKYQQTDSEEYGELLKANVKRINDRNCQVKFVTENNF